MNLLDKHAQSVNDDDEIRNLMKMACDVIIHILNGGEFMFKFSTPKLPCDEPFMKGLFGSCLIQLS